MRPFTVCYALMTLSLGSVVAYTIMHSEKLGTTVLSHGEAFAYHTGNDTIVMTAPKARPEAAAPSTSEKTEPAPATDDSFDGAVAAVQADMVQAGMSPADVRALLGEPDSINGTRWTYGSNVLIFNGERLAGHISFDPVEAALNKYNRVIESIAQPAEPAKNAKGALVKKGPKLLHAKTTSPQIVSKQRHDPWLAGSSRDAFRYNKTGQEYSYYMNRSGPMDRFFLRKPSLPRGMTTTADRNLSRSYQPYSNTTRYGMNPAFAYRR
jgi:hypothetical protein